MFIDLIIEYCKYYAKLPIHSFQIIRPNVKVSNKIINILFLIQLKNYDFRSTFKGATIISFEIKKFKYYRKIFIELNVAWYIN